MANPFQTTPSLMEGGTAVWRGLFTPAELDALAGQCDMLELEQARLTGSYGIRTTQVAWVHRARRHRTCTCAWKRRCCG